MSDFSLCKDQLSLNGRSVHYFCLPKLASQIGSDFTRIPYTIRILLEGCLRQLDRGGFGEEALKTVAAWQPASTGERPAVPFMPARVLMQDFTGVPVLNDLTGLRAALKRQGKQGWQVNPTVPCDLVVDHSLTVEAYACPEAQKLNEAREFELNRERYEFLKWSQKAYKNLRVLPPGLGICHQVNLEYLAQVAFLDEAEGMVYPDSVLGTDSHTTMVNGLGVLGWGVGGIEALAAMLGYPSEFSLPDVVGVELAGALPKGVTPTDLTLTLTSKLREMGVVNQFVEVIGQGAAGLPVETRAMIANMSPESGATATYFPVDAQTIDYLRRTSRAPEQFALVEAYFRAQGLFREATSSLPAYSRTLKLHLNEIEPVMAGPKRPQDIFALSAAKNSFSAGLSAPKGNAGFGLEPGQLGVHVSVQTSKGKFELANGAVIIAAITSCTNTSDPGVLITAALLARSAAAKGLAPKPWVKTSFAPGSRAVSVYLNDAGLMGGLESLGFHVVGYGCTTCIGNSGPVDAAISQAIKESNLVCAAVLSGNRNFEGRIHPDARASFLAAPPLVVAYALAGTLDFDFDTESLGMDAAGQPVYLRDIWPSVDEINAVAGKFVRAEIYHRNYEGLYEGNPAWNAMAVPDGGLYPWEEASSLIREPDFLLNAAKTGAICGAHVLALLGDSITTDHISPAGRIAPDNPAGQYLRGLGVSPDGFISFGARRGNHEVMARGTFSNPRLRNQLLPDVEGGFTRHFGSGETMPIYEAALRYKQTETPLVILAGKLYGSGSSRDWAAKGTALLGVRAVIAESYERIHRTNLACMGVLPLQYLPGQNAASLGLKGDETFSIPYAGSLDQLRQRVSVEVERPDGSRFTFEALSRVDTPLEMAYFKAGGLMPKVLADLAG